MTKFFKTLEELKASLPTKFNVVPEGGSIWNIKANQMHFYKSEAPRTAVVVNGNNLEKYLYTPKIHTFSFSQIKDVSYDFKLLETCLVANYQSLIDSKEIFEDILAPQYVRNSAFFSWARYQNDKKEGSFFAPKTAIVTNGEKLQEILYTPVKSKCLDSNWFTGSGKWEVEYQSEVISEAPISEVLAEFEL